MTGTGGKDTAAVALTAANVRAEFEPDGWQLRQGRSGHAVRPDRTRSMALLLVIIHLDFGVPAPSQGSCT